MRRVSELVSLKGRTAVITGGVGHIGSAMAEALAEVGAEIAIVDLFENSCKAVCERISKEFRCKALPLEVDLSVEEDVKNIPGKVTEHFRGFDILINCAAFVGTSDLEGWVTTFEDQSPATWRKALEVNLTAMFVLCQASAPILRKSGKGSIINIASTYGLVGPDMRIYEGTKMGNPAAYAVSKGGVIQMTRWLSTVLAPEIRVNSITPGGIWRNQPKTFHEKYVDRTPLLRMAKEEDFKGAAVYLAGDMSSYVTGHNLVVDGGWTAW